MKKLLSLVLCLMMVCLAAGCSGGSGSESESSGSASSSSGATVTGSGEEYTAYSDPDAPSFSVEYLGSTVESDEYSFVTDDFDDQKYFVLKLNYINELTLVTHDSDVDDPENKDCLDSSFVIRAVQNDKAIDPRGEGETETIEEDNAYSYIDAGSSIECEYWFPIDSYDPVTIQVLNPDGEDTVMAEVTFTRDEDADDDWEF